MGENTIALEHRRERTLAKGFGLKGPKKAVVGYKIAPDCFKTTYRSVNSCLCGCPQGNRLGTVSSSNLQG